MEIRPTYSKVCLVTFGVHLDHLLEDLEALHYFIVRDDVDMDLEVTTNQVEQRIIQVGLVVRSF